MSLELVNSSTEMLRDRAQCFALTRKFFEERGVLEVDVPMLSPYACIDANIDLISAKVCGHTAYLHSSPEYFMKRLLARKMGDIYQLSHVFRDGEISRKHNPEFMMVEWYRHGFSLEQMIEETLKYLALILQKEEPFGVQHFRYCDLFETFEGYYPENSQERDELLTFNIEPKLARDDFTVIVDFPEEEAALSVVIEKGGQRVANRFEILYGSCELANGYFELTDPAIYRERFERANELRARGGKPVYPFDLDFLEEIEQGIESCSGVAVGFDRLMMLRHNTQDIKDVLPFAFNVPVSVPVPVPEKKKKESGTGTGTLTGTKERRSTLRTC